MKHLLGAAALVAVLAVVAVGALEAMNLPVTASTQADTVDQMFRYEMWVIGVLAALVLGLMLYSILVFRRRSPDDGDGIHIHGNTPLEIFWTVAPLAIVVVFGWYAVNTLNEIVAAQEDELVVNVTGSQWAWSFEYPEQGIESSTLVLPKDRPVLFQITSLDVLHSFWILEFRLKQDAVPGIVRNLRITPNRVGDYQVRCAEICGAGHTTMLADVKVVEAEEFDTELEAASSGANLPPVERGAKLVKDLGCVACHSVDGSKLVGPTWLGVMGRQEKLEDGTTVTVDEEYVRNSVLDPASQVVAGFNKDIMPKNFGERLKEGDLEAIIAYLNSLSAPAGP